MNTLKAEEIKQILDDLYEVHGYDFSNYSPASLKRRLLRLFEMDHFPAYAEFRHRIRNDKDYIKKVVEEITVNVTEMFRDPSFYKALRDEIIPLIRMKPFIRIWHAGCSTGEEVYSMAILLEEHGLLDKSLLYATDLNPEVLASARKGIFPLHQMQLYSRNYILSGGLKDFSSYYTVGYNHAQFDPALSRKMIFSTHNLVSDNSFNLFDLIICRNVLIYFDKTLQDRVLGLFDYSLDTLGFLALGSKETLRYSGLQARYVQHGKEKIWRKKS